MQTDPTALYRQPDPLVSQGDVVAGVPHLHLKPPLSVLRPTTTNRGQMLKPFVVEDVADTPQGGFRFARGEPEQVVASCQLARGIILTHGCEIDKDDKHRLVALVRPLSGVPADGQAIIRGNLNASTFYLPAYPGVFEESYVDFRRITCVDPRLIRFDRRLASLTREGLTQFLAKFFLYITRAEVEALENLLGKR